MFLFKIRNIKQHRKNFSFYKEDETPMISFLDGDFKQSKFYLFFVNKNTPYVIYDEENEIFGFLNEIKGDYFYYNMYQSTISVSTILFEISDYLYYSNGLTKKILKKRLARCLKELKELYREVETDNKKILIGKSLSCFYSGKINIKQHDENNTLSFEIGSEISDSAKEELFDVSRAFLKYAQERLSSLKISDGKEDSYWYLKVN